MNRIAASILLALVFVGCAQPRGTGCIEIVDTVVGDFRDTAASADFAVELRCAEPEPPLADGCTATERGACTLIRCDADFFGDVAFPAPPSPLSAGALVLSGAGTDVTLEESTPGTYDAALAGLPAGAHVAFAASGADVGPFSIDAIAPGLPVLEAPARVLPGDDLVLRWTPPAGTPAMTVTITDTFLSFGGPTATLRCAPDASTGELVIPASDLAALDTHGGRATLFASASYRAVATTIENGADVTLEILATSVGPSIER